MIFEKDIKSLPNKVTLIVMKNYKSQLYCHELAFLKMDSSIPQCA